MDVSRHNASVHVSAGTGEGCSRPLQRVIGISDYQVEARLWAFAESSPAFSVYRQLELLKQSYSILAGNHGDLVRVPSAWNSKFDLCANDSELRKALEVSSADEVVFPYC